MTSLALRLLLALCLVLNGVGSAMAAAVMPAGMGRAVAVLDAEPQAAGLCAHGETDSRGSATIEHAAPATPHPSSCEQDGCVQSDCSCLCMQLAQAVLLDAPVMSEPPGPSRQVTAFPAGHSTPALLHPIRPPIG